MKRIGCLLAILTFILCGSFYFYCVWTAFTEGRSRSHRSRVRMLINAGEKTLRGLTTATLSAIETSKTISLYSILPPQDWVNIPFEFRPSMFVIVNGDDVLIYEGSREEGGLLLKEVLLSKTLNRIESLRYDPTNGTLTSGGREFLYFENGEMRWNGNR